MNTKLSSHQIDELLFDCLSYLDAIIRSIRNNSIPDLDLLMHSRAIVKAIQTTGTETLDYFDVYQDMIDMNGKPVTTLNLISELVESKIFESP